MSNKRLFEFVEGTSNKFWEVWTEGSVLKTRYGKIGSSGQTTLKDEGSDAAALKLYEKLIREKTGKGYVEKTAANAPAAKAAPAPAKKPAKATAAKPGVALRGKVVVVTGTFKTPRKDVEKRLVAAGCTLGSSVTKKTDLLVVGADAGSKLAAATSLGVAVMTEAEFEALLAGAETASASTPSPTAPAAQWQVYADQLQAAGDPRGQVLAMQLALEAKPKDATALRTAEREALKPLLVGPLADALARFDALAAKLKADPQVVLLAWFSHPPATEREIAKVEQALGTPLHPAIATFFRQTNGLQLYADRRDRDEFEDEFKPVTTFNKKAVDAMSDFSQNFQLSYGLHIPPLSELFLTDVRAQLGYDEDEEEEGDEDFGKRTFPRGVFAKSLRLLDVHNGYRPIAFALVDHPENPRLGMGEDHGVDWSTTRTTDFETFITTVLKNDARQEKMERFFDR